MCEDDIKSGEGFEDLPEDIDAMGAYEDLMGDEGQSDMDKLRESIEALQHVIAGATVAIVAGQVFTAMAQRRHESGYTDKGAAAESALIARQLMEEVGNV